MPTIQVTYNAFKVAIALAKFQENGNNSIKNEDFALCFTYELMNETSRL